MASPDSSTTDHGGPPGTPLASAPAAAAGTAIGAGPRQVRHVLTVGLLAVSALNLAANIVVSRLIPRAEYGAASSLLALAALLAIPLSSIQPAVTRQVSVARPGALRLWPPTGWAAAGGVGIVVVARLAVPGLDRLLHLSGAWAIVVFGAYVAAILAEGVPRGALVGERRYLVVALLVTLGAVVRLAVAVIWSAARPGDLGPLAGAALGEALTAATLALALWRFGATGVRDRRLGLREVWLSAAGFTGLLSVMSIDTVAARHWLSGPASGLYAAASIVGSIAYFLPTAAAVAVFPDVAKGVSAKDGRSFFVGLSEVAVLAAGTAALLALAAPLVISFVYPTGYAGARAPLQILSVSYACLGVLGYLVNHHLAHGSRTILLPWFGAALLTALVFVAHGSPSVVALDALVASAAMLVVMGVASAVLERRPARARLHAVRRR